MASVVVQRRLRMSPVQAAFHHSQARLRGFVGGRGSGKTFAGSMDLLRRAKRGHTYLVASPTAVIMSDTTLPVILNMAREWDILNPDGIRMSPYPTFTLTTGAVIRFRTAEDPERMRGQNLSGIWLDEASLMNREAFTICMACLREHGEQGWLSATFTPKGFNHFTYEIFGKNQPDTETFHASSWQNPFLPAEFAPSLQAVYTEQEQRQELAGEFIDADEHLQVIPTAWVRAAMQRWTPDGRAGRKLSCLGIDVARGGAAKTILARRHGNWWDRLLKYPGQSTPDGFVVGQLVAMALADSPQALVNIDKIGVGAAVMDECKRRRIRHVGINFADSTKATDRNGLIHFANVRSWAWWSFRELLDPRNQQGVQLPPDEELLADLTTVRWKAVAGGIQLEKKEEVEKRLGRTVDCGDAVIYSAILPT